MIRGTRELLSILRIVYTYSMMKIKRILIVDDDIEYMNELVELLVREAFEVIKKNNTFRILVFIKRSDLSLSFWILRRFSVGDQ